MKVSALQQTHGNRRPNTFRGGSAPPDSASDGSARSPAAIFWLVLHLLCCFISLVLGFRFSRMVFFFLFSTPSTNHYTPPFWSGTELAGTLRLHSSPAAENFTGFPANRTATVGSSSSRVMVGRHGIRIRPWPHPNPAEVMKAHQIIERVQREQRMQFGVKSPRTVIVVTPTYVRTFQALHLTGVMHSLMLVPYDLVWVVVEAGGVTNETASILDRSGLRTVHIGFDQQMPTSWEDRHKMEALMRLRALKVIQEEKLDGVVMFADDSNMHSTELFDEIQKVKWIGAVSVGILAHLGDTDKLPSVVPQRKEIEETKLMPVQGPACNSSEQLIGWHTFNSLPYVGKSAIHIDDRAVVLPRKLEWSGFVLNSRLLWKEAEDKPDWMKDLDTLGGADEDADSPLSLVKDPSVVEPLGSCGRQVLLWWLRVEARADSKFPPGWMIDPPLDITVPSKHTPWPDAPPELPTSEKEINVTEHIVKRSSRTRTSRSKRSSRSKRKHEAKPVDAQVSSRHSEQK